MDRSLLSERWLHPVALAAIFVVGLLPFTFDHLLFHPDERHYVDAGMQMAQSGDWLTPRTSEGELRLRKPVLPYWLVAAGCQLLGPSPFSTRILFLLCGAAVVAFSWRAARQAIGSERAATLTALVVMCQPALLLSAARSLPDVAMAAFLAMSLSGFVSMIARGRADWSDLALAYLGGALAVLSKGAPAAAFVVYASGYLLACHWTLVAGHWQRFAISAGACGALAGSWFALMQVWHGDALASQFVADQAGAARFAPNLSQVALQALGGVGLLLASFAIPLVPAARTMFRRRHDVAAILDRDVNHFLLGWVALFLAAAACVNHVSLRYLLPAVPAAAVLLGGLLTELEGPLLRRNFRWIAWISLALPVGAGALAVSIRWTQSPLTAVLLAFTVMFAVAWLRGQMRFTNGLRSAAVAAAGLHAALFLCSLAGIEVMGESFGRRMSDAVLAIDPHAELVLLGEPAHATRVRVCSAGSLRVLEAEANAANLARAERRAIASLDESMLPKADAGYRRVRVACGFHRIDPDELVDALFHGELSQLIRQRRREYVVALPVSPAGDSQDSTPIAAQSQIATGQDGEAAVTR